MKRILVMIFVLMASLVTVGCTERASATKPAMPTPVKPNFILPTAEQAYKLQDDCTRRSAAILRHNVIGYALTHEAVGRYNASTNRCYVRLEVHTADLTTKWQDYYSSIYLQDGQTEELLAFITTRFDDKGTRRIAFLGFGCDITGDPSCVADKIVACMGGKECDPQ